MYERSNFEVKPMRFYKEDNYLSMRDVEVDDIVVAKVVSYYNGIIKLKVGQMDAVMDLEDINSYDDEAKNSKFVVAQIGKRMLCRIRNKKDNTLYLERRSVVDETIDYLRENIGSIVPATVEAIEPYGIFVDIGNGVNSLIRVKEVSKSRHYDLSKILEKGESTNVMILDFDPETSYFEVSRKQAYQMLSLEAGMITEVICSHPIEDETGIFVECDPGHSGIMDVPEKMSAYDFKDGTKVQAIITKVLDIRFRCDFIGFV